MMMVWPSSFFALTFGPSSYIRIPSMAMPERAFFVSYPLSTALIMQSFGGIEQSQVSSINGSCELVGWSVLRKHQQTHERLLEKLPCQQYSMRIV
jgi:hypothetical protein